MKTVNLDKFKTNKEHHFYCPELNLVPVWLCNILMNRVLKNIEHLMVIAVPLESIYFMSKSENLLYYFICYTILKCI